MTVTRAPYGSWRSPFPIPMLVDGVVSLRETRIAGTDIVWIETRPSEGGRFVVVRRHADGRTEDVSAPGTNARDRVHEYGGASALVDGDTIYHSSWTDGRWYRRAADGSVAPITPEGAFRYADPVLDRRRERLVAVREDHTGAGEAVNTIVAIPLDGRPPAILVDGHDFFSSPRLSPDGSRLAWLAWDHPNLPWDGTMLFVAPVAPDGSLGSADRVAGSPTEWVAQPAWSPDGVLHFVSERTGWMNLYRRVDGADEALTPIEAEFAHPDWVFGLSTYGFADDGRILAIGRSGGRDRLYEIAREGPGAEPAPLAVELPFTEMEFLSVSGGRAVLIGSGPANFPSVVALDTHDRSWTILKSSDRAGLDPRDVSAPEPIEFRTSGGQTAFGLFYPPRNSAYAGTEGTLPPLIVTSHGGPTAAASTGLSIGTQLFTSRGFAVLDVDYGGSTGYGRDYRKRLEGAWGIVDVEDCANGALELARRGLVDPDRIAIRGGSASGYTTLCAITFRDEFRAGVSYFGIGDLETFVSTTHKFESRYVDRLVGPYPEAKALYRERSPLNFGDRISCPVLILQGLDDHIVPPAQAEQIVAGLRANGIPHAYIAYEGEDHGFRKASSIIDSFEAELSFFAQVFGFEPADEIPVIRIENLPATSSTPV